MRSTLAGLVVLSATAWSTIATLTCQEITIPVDIAARNWILPSDLTASSLDLDFYLNTIANLETAIVGGRYSISARYCPPTTVIASRQASLQILVHGGTYTKNYWSGLAAPGTLPGQDEYSWIIYAAAQGYPTLSIDRLCNGNSSHLNSLLCQYPLQNEALHAVIQQARAGTLPINNGGNSPAFNRIILAGHSFGSLLVTELARDHPYDVDALLTTGFSFNLLKGLGLLALFQLLPAFVARDGSFTGLDPGYLAITSKSGFETGFYHGNFERSELDYDFAHPGTVALGELATFYPVGQAPVLEYRNPLFVLNGNNDAAFCQVDPLEPVTGGDGGGVGLARPNCSLGYSEAVHVGFPAVERFGFHNTPETGHCLNLHTTAQESFAAAHEWLESVGF